MNSRNQHAEIICTEHAPIWAEPLQVAVMPLPDGRCFSLALGALAAGTELLPCLSGAAISGYRFSLRADGLRPFALPAIGEPSAVDTDDHERSWATARVDWLQLHQNLANAYLDVELSPGSKMQGALLHCSWRSGDRHLVAPAKALASQRLLAVPALSQMTLAADIRKRACSPASVAMVLAYYGIEVNLTAFSAQAFHAPSKLHGVWPCNMLAASQFGLATSVRYFRDLTEIVRLLDLGMPVPVSICYEQGELPQAALPQSAGHVLVVTGIDQGMVHVNDPAAPSADAVAKRHDIEAFNRAWQRHHRMGYMIHPQAAANG